MFRVIAALMLASAAGASVAAVTTPKTTAPSARAPATETAKSDPSDMLVASQPWWEKVTVTIAGNGKAESCKYESSLKPNAPQDCDVADTGAAAMTSASEHSSDKQEYTRITFERRFDPNALPAKADLQKGDTLLGGQVMSLAINGRGKVDNCRIVAQSGDMQPQYGCDEASAEKFQASAPTGAAAVQHQGYMTILVYGHSEHMV
ncbi:MAG TPA: hypothetical protein VFU91_08040 [Sphingomicrobium sp.]|nr:hypothetical protein [Sphingomicrobium sp.]